MANPNPVPGYMDRYGDAKSSLPGPSSLRDEAIGLFERNGFPAVKREAWRYTRLSPLTAEIAAPAQPAEIDPAYVDAHRIDGAATMVFVNGFYDDRLSRLDRLPKGVELTSLAVALTAGDDQLTGQLTGQLRAANSEDPDEALVALNTAFTGDGAVIVAASEASGDIPIQLLHVASGPGMTHPRHLVVVEDGSALSVVETYIGQGSDSYWTNAVVQITVGDGAKLDWVKYQGEAAEAYHIAAMRVRLAENAEFNAGFFALGGAIGRDDIAVTVAGSGARCALNGVTLGRGKQSLTTLTSLDHAVAGANSDQAFKSVLDEGAQAAFQGKVIVRPDAQKTEAHQTNHNLLLARSAEVNTKPELEILADDVACSHGATVGEIDKEAMFYLLSRGLDEATARRLLVEGFVAEIVERVSVAGARDQIARAVGKWLGGEETGDV